MTHGLVTMSYIAASICFILSLSGLSRQDTSLRGNYLGMAGMAIAIIATIFSNGPIAGMPVLECWKGGTIIVLKRSMA